jgi:chaperonin GroES
LIVAHKYEKPEKARGIWIAPAWRQDNSRALWEVAVSSKEAEEHLKMTLHEGDILVTPPNSGIFLDYEIGEEERFDGEVAPRVRERYLLHAALVARVIPWNREETMKTLGTRLLVRPDAPTQKGVVIRPETSEKRPVTGVIVDVGRAVEDEDLYVGARILYSLYAGTDLEVEGERRVLLNADQALAIVGADEVVEAV